MRLTKDPLLDTHHMVDHAQTSELLENTKSLHTNGRSNNYNNRGNNFTSISTKGSTVVDYCL